ncbi:leukocyte tyrosine kinase receptor [Prorops nasuta]|uniref:leukocyte tyrosine kinase receptor n=1 Tax=Prorops nasuta TaxID=863751 RepID=UPI0034CD27B1
MSKDSRCSGLQLLELLLWLGWLWLGDGSHEGRRAAAREESKATQDALGRVLNDQPSPLLGRCNFEDEICGWSWTNFTKAKPPLAAPLAPVVDATNNKNGWFLWLQGRGEGQMRSEMIPQTGSSCSLQLTLYQVEMANGNISLVINTTNTSIVSTVRQGNNSARWETTHFNLGSRSQPHHLFLEIALPYSNSSIAVDNIRLVNCFPESTPVGTTCTDDMFRCHNGSCLNRTRICDLTADCADGEDEEADCDEIPETARCNFESGWCGWANVDGRPLEWTLRHGPAPTEITGPSYDHTYRNETGTYAYVEMSKRKVQRGELGDSAIMNSSIFNPTPPYSSDPNSSYFESCKIRFFYHKHGVQSGGLAVHLVELQPHESKRERIWWKYGNLNNIWYNAVKALPEIKYRYYLQFEATKSYGSVGDMAIDDFSLSPECFGIGVPPEVKKDFDYYNPVIEPEKEGHADFANKTVVRISTCGARGRTGPTYEQCANEYNGTDVKLLEPPSSASSREDSTSFNMPGVQTWTAPSGGHYTLIGLGAGGGKSSSGQGSTLGALVRGVIELEKGQQLYFMVGQPGMDACPKSVKRNDCQERRTSNGTPLVTQIATAVKNDQNIMIKKGGGGGGGATYVFTLKANGEHEALLVAAGGGGGGLGNSVNDSDQHGRARAPSGAIPTNGVSLNGSAGGGGGWNGSVNSVLGQRASSGMPLIRGGLGGAGCGSGNGSHGDGGFGGGGGGCFTGGGGGGYIGGSTGLAKSSNGEGGYSYASKNLTHILVKRAANHGAGQVFVVPAISGCGCDYRCIALDQFLSETECLCPAGWKLGNDSKSCLTDSETSVTHQTFMFMLIGVSTILVLAFSGLCLLLYNRYQNKKALLRRRQVMFGNGTELTALRTVSDSMMTEFNPNYEFAGNLYSFKDLPQIPRDNIALIKPLGQGAFGEVSQGIYKYRRDEEHPVAVKTLPSLSTSQAEADFMMEALIMSKFNHPNIVRFIGVSFDKHPRYIVLELLAGGDLKNFLREERPRPDRPTTLTMQDLVMCAYDVASGCKYMEDARFIHRDIAARNCLLTCKGPGRIVKIADFGMARDIYRSDYYRKGGKAMLPIKWMPPESFLDGIFTTKTDVWAFGVLLWEIMSFGYMPYTGCANREVMSMVTTGGRLERPAGCPDPIYGIMTRCWHPRPEDRPSFATIVERIGYCLQDPDVLNHPMPNYDILPVCEREITIMRPDPETECINVHADLDGCGYMQPRGFRPTSYRIGTIPGGLVFDHENMDHPRGRFCRDACDTSADTFEDSCGSCDGDTNTRDDQESTNPAKERRNEAEPRGAENAKAWGLENSKPEVEDKCCDGAEENSTLRSSHGATSKAVENRRNGDDSGAAGNDWTRAAQFPETPPDTGTNSSPNTRTCSPSRSVLNNANNNVNGILKKSALKAALSLDASALCRGTIPYEKIAFSQPAPPPQRPTSTSNTNTGNVERRKDSLSHELPREEECSC